MSIRKCDYKVFLYKNDYIAMCNEVFRYQCLETGGNLFGLWTTSGNVVVHVVLGPGKDCRRTKTSFHQDINYMSNVGRFLKKSMLCQIGEWRSYHRLNLDGPSWDDKETMKRNYSKDSNDMKRFLVIIANIVAHDEDSVVLSPYFFTNNGNTCEKGVLIVLDADSPFTKDLKIASKIKDGSENLLWQPVQRPVVNSDYSLTKDQRRENGSLNRRIDKNPLQSAADNPSYEFDDNSTCMDIDVPPPRCKDGPTPSHTITRDPSVTQTTVTRSNPRDTQIQTMQEIILHKVYQEIQSQLHCSDVTIERNTVSRDVGMKFKHNNRYWLIEFPRVFPMQPAKIRNKISENGLYYEVCQAHDVYPLNNYIAILLVIKTECSCSLCEKITADSLVRSDPSLSLFLTEEGNNVLQELLVKIESTIATLGTLRKELKINGGYPKKYPVMEVSFTHNSKTWVVKLTSSFPGHPAKVSCKENGIFGMSKKPVLSRNSLLKLDRVCNILSIISQHCRCEKCQSLQLK